ncbi:MAG: hypothetical protein ACREK8_11340 [Gemmatimonadales bacterium]
MTPSSAEEWFAARTTGAPEALRRRATAFFQQDGSPELPTRLSLAGQAALDAAIRGGTGRSAALDLLAADALITLALLAGVERDPANLGRAASALRVHASTSADSPRD